MAERPERAQVTVGPAGRLLDDGGGNPFIDHREQLDVYRHARAAGMADADYVALVADADARVADVDGRGFVATPLVEADLGPSWVDAGPVVAKVETANVSGSHKARHLFGLLLRLLIDEASDPGRRRRDLAIASCGNAALGAAVVARSAGRRLRVFVPVEADAVVVDRLDELGAEVTVSNRVAGEAGDPCLRDLHHAISVGATAFTVQGPLAPDVIDGGRTLGLELAQQLRRSGLAPERIYLQIGGGALATAMLDGLARSTVGPRSLPRLHPVQARSAHPYVAAWLAVAAALAAEHGRRPGADPRAAADAVAPLVGELALPEALDHHADLVEPWPGTPISVASGILDDVTYDWRGVMTHQLRTGGWPILVDEEVFVAAAELASGIATPAPDETGAAGLAGLLQQVLDRRSLASSPEEADGGTAVVVLTGARRG